MLYPFTDWKCFHNLVLSEEYFVVAEADVHLSSVGGWTMRSHPDWGAENQDFCVHDTV